MEKIEIGSIKHAFRSEMSQVIHWSLISAVAIVIGLQLSQAGAAHISDINQIYELLK